MTVIDGTSGDTPAHACIVTVSDDQVYEMVAGFLAEGLAAGERVVFVDGGSSAGVLERLEDDDVATAGPLSSGQLLVVPVRHSGLATTRSPARVLGALDAMISDALDDGYPGIRLTGDSAVGAGSDGGAAMLAWEAGFDAVLARRPARVMCVYDQRRYSECDIARLRTVHHTELISPAVYDDGLLRITAEAVNHARLAGEADHTNRPLIRTVLSAALDDALRSHSAEARIHLDLSSLRFIDVAGAVSLVHAAEEFPSTHELVLTGVRPGVLRLLDRCGAPFAAQLRIEPRRQPAASAPDDGDREHGAPGGDTGDDPGGGSASRASSARHRRPLPAGRDRRHQVEQQHSGLEHDTPEHDPEDHDGYRDASPPVRAAS